MLEIAFDDGRGFRLPYEYLRVYSPSAEVRGHGPGQEVLQTGKRDVEIRPLKRSALRGAPSFSDGHGTGIYSWDYLYELGENQEMWRSTWSGSPKPADHGIRAMKDHTDFGYERVPQGEKARRVGAVFDRRVADYDLMNDLMSLGLHRVWKAFAIGPSRGRARG